MQWLCPRDNRWSAEKLRQSKEALEAGIIPPGELELVVLGGRHRALAIKYLYEENGPTKGNPAFSAVLAMVCEGAQNKEIAYRLNLSEVIVKADVKSICRKLGVRNRTEAAMMARNEGLC